MLNDLNRTLCTRRSQHSTPPLRLRYPLNRQSSKSTLEEQESFNKNAYKPIGRCLLVGRETTDMVGKRALITFPS
ncbi:hypothetical protein BCR44DRAFT_1442065 [Catenaria anguillulae PL171]|uniref:Uncharacterized protein n=1 Tax=Catenaria anguillulae PL171 TaxID=765915 RepID=A0A1Y2HAJ2_9FUNG|nr:hypothetical protein BCR44DRAFT_1442065 [Catenaria anguillulae PL171]